MKYIDEMLNRALRSMDLTHARRLGTVNDTARLFYERSRQR